MPGREPRRPRGARMPLGRAAILLSRYQAGMSALLFALFAWLSCGGSITSACARTAHEPGTDAGECCGVGEDGSCCQDCLDENFGCCNCGCDNSLVLTDGDPTQFDFCEGCRGCVDRWGCLDECAAEGTCAGLASCLVSCKIMYCGGQPGKCFAMCRSQ